MKYKILMVMALLLNASLIQSCNESTKTTSTTTEMDSSMNHTMPADSMNDAMMNRENSMMQMMNTMMSNMHAMKSSGDFDVDFANMMIIHHQAAIDMSEVQVAKGNDPQIKTMAQNIITAQKVEIEKMQQLVNDYKIPDTKKQAPEMHEALGATMKSMMDDMATIKMTGNTDKDYVMMMIPHHKSAVKMAGTELSDGKLAALKNMATKMVEDQNNEIKEFQLWLDKNK